MFLRWYNTMCVQAAAENDTIMCKTFVLEISMYQ